MQIYSIYILLMEKAMAPHSSTLAWKIPWMQEAGGLQSMGLLIVGHGWVSSLSLFTFMHWRRKMQPTPVFLAWRIPGTGEPGGLLSMGLHRVGHDWSDLAGAEAAYTVKKKKTNSVCRYVLASQARDVDYKVECRKLDFGEKIGLEYKCESG